MSWQLLCLYRPHGRAALTPQVRVRGLIAQDHLLDLFCAIWLSPWAQRPKILDVISNQLHGGLGLLLIQREVKIQRLLPLLPRLGGASRVTTIPLNLELSGRLSLSPKPHIIKVLLHGAYRPLPLILGVAFGSVTGPLLRWAIGHRRWRFPTARDVKYL
jgi:hypothetical protein